MLAEYRYAPNASSASARLAGPTTPPPALATTNLAKDNVTLPFTLKTEFELEAHGGKYYLREPDSDWKSNELLPCRQL